MVKWLLDLIFGKKTKKMLNIILFGPPGSGKGTQASLLKDKFNLIHISTGDLFRYEIGNKTTLGREAKSFMDNGELVPDRITIGMLQNKMDKHLDSNGFILDGFPRTINQSEALDKIFQERSISISGLVSLKVEENELVNRLLERGKTSGRTDDADEEIIRNRIKVYHDQTSPVYNYYDKLGLSCTIDGLGSIDDIFARLSDAFERLS